MLEGIFSSEVYQVLEKSLNASSLQHKMISNNIANVIRPVLNGRKSISSNFPKFLIKR